MNRARLHSIVEDHATRIVDRFVSETREHDLVPGPLSHDEVANHLHKYLREMARALRRDDVDSVDALSSATEHGEQRWYLGYDLKSVIMEYSILRDAILHVAEEAGHSLTIREFRDLAQFQTVGIANAVVEFTEKSTREIKEALRTAEHATHVREDVVAIVSHDLKDPLQVIHTSVAMLLHEVSDSDLSSKRSSIQKKLGGIQRASQKMDALITDLLDLARIRAGKLSGEMRPEQVGDLLREACEQAASLAEQRSIRMDKQLVSPGTVVCDRSRVLQVFANVIGNAIKFSPPGSTIFLRASSSDEECTFEIHDQGSGIPADRIPRLFDRFWRSSGTTPEGTGLGLAIAKGIVDYHGGRIWVHSESGNGTTCSFTLPTRGPLKGRAPLASSPPA
jgi:signal transduction histidine kinase